MADSEKQTGSSLDATSEHRDTSSTIHSPADSIRPLFPEPPVNVGYQSYLVVFGAFMALFCTFGQLNSFGTFQAWYGEHQMRHYSPSSISWIGSIQLFMFFFTGWPVGRAFDFYGPLPVMIVGSVVHLTSIVLTSVSTQYYQYILCQGILFGLGVGLIFYPALATISILFQRYRATAIGVASAGSGLGGVVYPIALQYLFKNIKFGWAVRATGLVSIVCCAVAVFSVRQIAAQGRKSGPLDYKKNFCDITFMTFTAGNFFICFGIFIPFFYIVDYTKEEVGSQSVANFVLAIMNAGGVVGRVAPAYLSDTIGRFNLLVPSVFFAGLSCLVMWMFSHSLPSVIAFAVLYGILSGAFISVITPCVAQISDVREVGTRIGVLYTLVSVPSLFGGPIAGALLAASHHRYECMIGFTGGTMIIGSLFILGAKYKIEARMLAHV